MAWRDHLETDLGRSMKPIDDWPRPCSFCGRVLVAKPPVPSSHPICATCRDERHVIQQLKDDAFKRGIAKGAA